MRRREFITSACFGLALVMTQFGLLYVQAAIGLQKGIDF